MSQQEFEILIDAESVSISIVDRLQHTEIFGDALETPLAALRIPDRFRIGIATIARVTDASFIDLVSALKLRSIGDTASDLASKIESVVTSIPVAETEVIIAAVSAMQGVQKAAHANSERFTTDILAALEDDSPDLMEGVDAELLKRRLDTLFSETSIHLTSAKVSELRSEIERAFCGARVLTDVRTAFPDDAKEQPAMTIMHTLEIMFHDDMGRHREFYVALDDNDLLILKDAVERAAEKKKTLVDLLKKANFEIFD